jgi:Predicted sugar phosphate isomerase
MQKLSETEKINKNTASLSTLTLDKQIDLMNEENLRSVLCLKKAKKSLKQAIVLVAKTYQEYKTTLFMGAGTSGRLGILEAAELPPTFSTLPQEFKAIIAGGNGAVFKAVEGAEDSADKGAKDFLKNSKNVGTLITIAASGNTPYIQGALKAAKQKKVSTILITSNKTAAKEYADIFIFLDSGAEFISGSTRLKAASAAKFALNMITTLAMTKCNKVYKNYMVDVKATNTKLKARAVRLISLILNISQEKAEVLAKQTKYKVKEAVLLGKSKKNYKTLLKKYKGNLEVALNEK